MKANIKPFKNKIKRRRRIWHPLNLRKLKNNIQDLVQNKVEIFLKSIISNKKIKNFKVLL